MKTCLLLSGGMDSIALAWWKRPDIAITIDYGQLCAAAEIEAAQSICQLLEIEHQIISVDCSSLGSGDMAGKNPDSLAPESDWWPFRNQMLATFAGMKAISLQATELWFGTVKSDQFHADGRPEFFEAMTYLMSLQEGNIVVKAPAIEFSTFELIQEAGLPTGYLAYAHSCHTSNVPCGKCRGCNKYTQVYKTIGLDLDALA